MRKCLIIHGIKTYVSVTSLSNSGPVNNEYDDYTVGEIFMEYYEKIIELCEENDITVRGIETALAEGSVFGDNYEKEFWNYYRVLENRHSNFKMEWPVKTMEYQYFRDPWHMNINGAREFTLLIKSNHPEDFSNDMTDEQMEVVDDDINIVDDPVELIKWIRGLEYTALIYDEADKDVNYITENEAGLIYQIENNGNDFEIITPEGMSLVWETTEAYDKEICILNDRTHSIVKTIGF